MTACVFLVAISQEVTALSRRPLVVEKFYEIRTAVPTLTPVPTSSRYLSHLRPKALSSPRLDCCLHTTPSQTPPLPYAYTLPQSYTLSTISVRPSRTFRSLLPTPSPSRTRSPSLLPSRTRSPLLLPSHAPTERPTLCEYTNATHETRVETQLCLETDKFSGLRYVGRAAGISALIIVAVITTAILVVVLHRRRDRSSYCTCVG